MPEDKTAEIQKSLDAATATTTKLLEIVKSLPGYDFDENTMALTKKAEPEMIEVGGVMVEKSAVPAPVIAQLEKQSADIEALKARDKEVSLTKAVEQTIPNLPGTVATKSALMDAVHGIKDEAVRQDVLKSLTAADAATVESMKSIGIETEASADSPAAKLDTLVKSVMTEKSLGYEAAYTDVLGTPEGRKLVAAQRA